MAVADSFGNEAHNCRPRECTKKASKTLQRDMPKRKTSSGLILQTEDESSIKPKQKRGTIRKTQWSRNAQDKAEKVFPEVEAACQECCANVTDTRTSPVWIRFVLSYSTRMAGMTLSILTSASSRRPIATFTSSPDSTAQQRANKTVCYPLF